MRLMRLNEKTLKFLKEDASAVVFILLYIFGLLSFWFSVYKKNFDYETDFESIVENAGAPISVGFLPLLVSFLFMAMLVFFSIYGFFFHDKLMLLISFAYGFFLFAGIILLAVFQTGALEGSEMYDIIKWILIFDFGPVFGFIWLLGKAAVWIFTALFLVNAVFCFIRFIKYFKNRKNKI